MTAPVSYFSPLNIGGIVYDLGHLNPVRFQVASEKLRRAVTIQRSGASAAAAGAGPVRRTGDGRSRRAASSHTTGQKTIGRPEAP